MAERSDDVFLRHNKQYASSWTNVLLVDLDFFHFLGFQIIGPW